VRDALLVRDAEGFAWATDARRIRAGQVSVGGTTVASGLLRRSFACPAPARVARMKLTAPPTEVCHVSAADGIYSDGRRPDHVTYGNAESGRGSPRFTDQRIVSTIPAAVKFWIHVDGLRGFAGPMHLRDIGDGRPRSMKTKLGLLRAVSPLSPRSG